jgi:hypothetical protein
MASFYVKNETDKNEINTFGSCFYHSVMTQFTVAPLFGPKGPLLRTLCVVQVLIAILFLNL